MAGITLLLVLCVGVTVGTVVDLQKRIFGGQPCGQNERLYHVKLVDRNNKLLCGGSLIHPQWILTAAHCKIRSMKALLSVHPDPNIQTEHIINDDVIFKDKDQNNKDRIHDIMLLKLPSPIPHNQIKPIELPDCQNHPTPRPNTAEVQVAGHGPTDPAHSESKVLQCAKLKVVDCLWHINMQPNPEEAHQHMFCGQSSARVDTSHGDSGGGVVYNGRIYGVHASSGDPPFTEPAGFMDVCQYKQWIDATIARP